MDPPQEITLADLFFVPRGGRVFYEFGLGDLEKRTNVQRYAFYRI